MPAKWLSKLESEEFLKHGFYGRLATVKDGQPYITPVNYAYSDGKIWIHCNLHGRKVDNIRDSARVCFEVSEPKKLVKDQQPCNYGVRFTSVLAFGAAEIIDDLDTKLEGVNRIIAKYADGSDWTPLTKSTLSGIHVICIHVEEISGKINVDPEEM
jgi:hypothetical protein